MKTLCLFGVLLLARILILLGRDVPISVWSPAAFLWQDLAVVLAFAMLERMTVRRPWIAWTVYAVTALYVALNLPLFRLMSTPLTAPMLRAARGALADSIRHELTPENLSLIACVLGAAVMLPLILRGARPRRSMGAAAAVVAMATVALGPAATARVETGGLHRNFFFALIETAWPRVPATSADETDWRKSPFPDAGPSAAEQEDLSRFKGAAKGRNVVMVLLESTGARHLHRYGLTEDPMPHLTALARKSVLFENAYSVYPESIKGLFSVLCSRYPALDTKPEICARSTTPSIATVLADAGYRTALFHSGRFLYLGMKDVVEHRGFQILEDAGDIGGNHESSFGVDDAATARRMLNWIDSLHRSEKFFITYLPVAGHHPYEVPGPGPFPEHDDAGRYLNALHYGDAVLGELIEGLKARGLFNESLFIIFGDHGEAFGQHSGNFGHTLFIYEENVRVPYLIVVPGLVRKQIRVSRTASLIDTAPTILDLLGLQIPRDYQGSSLLQRSRQMALFLTDYSLGFLGLRDGRWKFICELESGRAKLFNLSIDPDETKNLAVAEPGPVEAYRTLLQRWAAAQRGLILHPKSETCVTRIAIPER